MSGLFQHMDHILFLCGSGFLILCIVSPAMRRCIRPWVPRLRARVSIVLLSITAPALTACADEWHVSITGQHHFPLVLFLNALLFAIGVFVILRRIRKTSPHLSETGQQSWNLIESSPNWTTLIDKNGCILRVNQSGATTINLPEDMIIGKRFVDFWPDAFRQKVASALTLALAGECSFLEADFHRSDSQLLTFSIALTPLFDESGRIHNCAVYCIDITNRRKAEQAVLQSQEQYKTLVESIGMGVTLISSDRRILTINTEHARMYATTTDELTGKYCFKVFEKRDQICPHCPGTQAMATGLPVEVETRGIRKDGSEMPVRVQAFPVRNPDGPATSFIEVVEDISERKKNEETLRKAGQAVHESEQQLSTIFKEAPVIIAITSLAEGRFLRVNDTFLRLLGFKNEELIGKTVEEAGVYKNFDDRRRLVKVLSEQDGARDFEVTLRGANGRDIVGLMTSTKIEINGQRCILSVVNDITERKYAEETLRKAEQAVHESEQQLSTIFRQAPSIILISSFPEGRVIRVNEGFLRVIGYRTEDLLGKTIGELHLYKNLDDRHRLHKILKEQSWARDLEITYCGANGSEFIGLTSSTLIEINGRPCAVTLISDITERKASEKRIRESEMKYRQLVEMAQEGIISVKLGGAIIFANRRMTELLGYTLPELLGRSIFSLFDVENEKLCREKLERRLQGIREQYELTLICKDGTKIITSVSASPLTDENGTCIGSIALISDITKRKRAENALRDSEEKLQALLDRSPIAILWANREGIIEYNNAKYLEMFGYTIEDIPSISRWFEVAFCHLPPRMFPSFMEEFYNTDQAEPKPREINVMCKDGSVRNVLLYRAMIGTRMLAMFSDITELKSAEDALRFRIELEKVIVGISTDLIHLPMENFDEGIQCALKNIGRFLEAEHGYLFLLSDDGTVFNNTHEWTSENLRAGEPVFQNIPAALFTYWVSQLPQFKNIPLPAPGAVPPEPLREDEMRKIQSMLMVPLASADKFLGCLGFDCTKQEQKWPTESMEFLIAVANAFVGAFEHRYIDQRLVTMNRELETRVFEKTERIQQMLKQKDEFMNELGHDLKTPLTPLMSLLPLINKGTSDPKMQKMLQVCINNAAYMRELVFRTLELFRLNSLQHRLCVEQLCLASSVNNALANSLLTEHYPGITVQIGVPPGLCVQADRVRLTEVFLNIFANAVRYMPARGTLFITASADPRRVIVTVTDSGIGIAPVHLDRIFDEFYKIDTSRHDRQTIGLGLSICKRIIEQHGGRIWAESKGEGKGTSIRFTLDRAPDNSEQQKS